MMATVGNKNIIAFYVPGGGYCNIDVVMSGRTDASDDLSGQVRVSLNPRESIHIDTADSHTLNLRCGNDAKTLAVIQ
jgi:hypothetical protein